LYKINYNYILWHSETSPTIHAVLDVVTCYDQWLCESKLLHWFRLIGLYKKALWPVSILQSLTILGLAVFISV